MRMPGIATGFPSGHGKSLTSAISRPRYKPSCRCSLTQTPRSGLMRGNSIRPRTAAGGRAAASPRPGAGSPSEFSKSSLSGVRGDRPGGEGRRPIRLPSCAGGPCSVTSCARTTSSAIRLYAEIRVWRRGRSPTARRLVAYLFPQLDCAAAETAALFCPALIRPASRKLLEVCVTQDTYWP